MPVGLWELALILIPGAALLIYIRIEIIIHLASAQEQRLLVEMSTVFNGRKKQYRYTESELWLYFFKEKDPEQEFRLKIFNLVRDYAVIEDFEWKTRVGFDDAMYTAIVAGLFWSAKGVIISLITTRSSMKNLMMTVEPDFTEAKLDSRLTCILKMRIVHIIIIKVYSFILKVRGYFNGSATGTTEPSH